MKVVVATTHEQLQQCLAIREEVFVREQQVPIELEWDQYDEAPDRCRHILVLDGDKAVATGRWRPYESGSSTAKLQRIAVRKDYRSSGVGRLLVGALEEDARLAGMTKAVLDGQVRVEGFYRKLGYVTVSKEPFLDAGIWHVRMEKPL